MHATPTAPFCDASVCRAHHESPGPAAVDFDRLLAVGGRTRRTARGGPQATRPAHDGGVWTTHRRGARFAGVQSNAARGAVAVRRGCEATLDTASVSRSTASSVLTAIAAHMQLATESVCPPLPHTAFEASPSRLVGVPSDRRHAAQRRRRFRLLDLRSQHLPALVGARGAAAHRIQTARAETRPRGLRTCTRTRVTPRALFTTHAPHAIDAIPDPSLSSPQAGRGWSLVRVSS